MGFLTQRLELQGYALHLKSARGQGGGAAGDHGSLMESEINSRKGVKGLKGCQVELIPTPTPRTCALHTGADGPGDKCLLAKSLTFIKLLSEGRTGR